MAGNDRVDRVVCSRDPASQAAAFIPIGPDLFTIVQTEPTPAARPIGLGVEGHDFQINRVPELHQVVVGAHVGMALPKRYIEIKAGSNVRDPLGQGWGDDGKVVELQHVSGVRYSGSEPWAHAPYDAMWRKPVDGGLRLPPSLIELGRTRSDQSAARAAR